MRHNEDGSISPALPIFFMSMIIIIGLVVDGGAKASAIATAQSACQQATRAAGQHILLTNGHTTINRGPAITAAGATGSITVNGSTITCTATTTTNTVFLNTIGITALNGTATTTADLAAKVQERP